MIGLARRTWSRTLRRRLGLHQLEDRTNPDTTYHNLAGGDFSQNWSSATQITTNDNWSGVPSLEGFLGQDITTLTGVNPQALTGTSAAANDLDVIANQSNPNTLMNGGVAEFDGIANPTIALQGSGNADAPYLQLRLNTLGRNRVTVGYTLRDIDGSVDNTWTPVALQYRTDESSAFRDIPAAFVADGSTGPSLATLSITKTIILPPDAENQAKVQIRWITTNSPASDEWIGIDDITVTSVATPTAGAYSFAASNFSVAESAVSFQVDVSRTGGTTTSAVDFTVTGGTATSGLDFTAASGTLTFTGSATTQSFNVTIAADGLLEPYETINLSLSAPTNGAVLGSSSAVLTIRESTLPQAVLNEVSVNPPTTTDSPFEYIELRGTPNAPADNLSVALVVGDTGTLQNIVGYSKNLVGSTFGSNGLLVIAANSGVGHTFPAGTTVVVDSYFGEQATLNGNSNSTIAIGLYSRQSASLILTGVPLGPNVTQLDAIGWSDGGAGDVVSAPVVLTNTSGTVPDAATRFPTKLTRNDGTAWYNGDLNPTGANNDVNYDLANVSANFPTGGKLTPGAANGPTPTSTAPTAANDTYSQLLNETVTYAASIGLLSNDTDAENDFLAVDLATVTPLTPNKGTLSVSADGSFLYIPDPTFTGSQVTFQYQATDGLQNSTAKTVTITFQQPPIITSDGGGVTASVSTPENTTLATTVAANDPEAATLSFSLVGGADQSFFQIDPTSGALSFKAAPNFENKADADVDGKYVVTVRVTDPDMLFDEQTITVTVTDVNETPVFTIPVGNTFTSNEDLMVVDQPYLTNIQDGPDPESPAQTVTFTVQVLSTTGTLSFATPPSITTVGTSGKLTYVPAADTNGTALVQVTAMDNGSPVQTSAPQQFTIVVNAVNDAPSVTLSPAPSQLEDTPGLQTVPNFVSVAPASNPVPADEASQTVSLTKLQIVGTTGNVAFVTAPSIDASGTLTFEVAPNTAGVATIEVTYKDSGDTKFGGVDTTTKSFTITVTPVNDAPTFTLAGDVTVDEDSGGVTSTGFLSNVVFGPSDESGQAILSLTATAADPSLFLVQPSIDKTTGTLTFTPAANKFGTTQVTVTLQDDGGKGAGGIDSSEQTFTIVINPINDAPVFTLSASPVVNEDEGPQAIPNFVTFTEGPFELTNTVSFAVMVTNITGTLTFTTTPSIDATGNLSFAVAGDTNGVATISVVASDNGSGTAPDVNTSIAQTFTISVLTVNDAPSFTLLGKLNINEDAGPQSIANYLTNLVVGPATATDELAAQTISKLEVTTTNASLFKTLPAINLTTGELTFETAADANGSATVTVTATDSGNTLRNGVNAFAQMFTITVNAVNDTPIITPNASTVFVQQNSSSKVVPTFATIQPGPATATDEQPQTLSVAITNNTNPALFASAPTIDANGNVTFTPATNRSGTAILTYTVTDNGTPNASSTGTLQIDILAINQPPTFTLAGNQKTLWNTGPQTVPNFVQNISPGTIDETTQKVTFSVVSNVVRGNLQLTKLAISDTGTLSYEAAPGTAGIATVQVIATDDGSGISPNINTSQPQIFTLIIDAKFSAPTVTAASTNEDTITSNGLVISPATGEGGPLTHYYITNIRGGSLFLANGMTAVIDGSFISAAQGGAGLRFLANPNQNAATLPSGFGFDVQASESANLSDVDVAKGVGTVNVAAVNDLPSFVVPFTTVMVEEDSGLFNAKPFAQSILPGPTTATDEASQPLTFVVTLLGATKGLTFAQMPSISPTGLLTFQPTANANGSADFEAKLSDGNGGFATQTFTINVSAVDDAPSFTLPTSISRPEDAGPIEIVGVAANISAGPSDEPQALTVVTTVLNRTNGLTFTTAPRFDLAGKLTFESAPDAFGTALVEVRFTDSANTTTAQTFTLIIDAVNDAPSFTIASSAKSAESASSVSIAKFATKILAGPANEANQPLTFALTLSSITGGLTFIQPPTIGLDGTLSYVSTPDSNGMAVVTVTLNDGNGGTASQQFNLSVTSVNNPPTFTIVDGISVAEDVGVVSKAKFLTNASTGPADESNQTLSFSTRILNTSGTLSFTQAPAIDNDGTLTFQASTDSNGTATIEAKATDNLGASSVRTFTITVTPVNDAPTLAATGLAKVDEDAGPVSIPGVVTISAGPSDEAGQVVTTSVEVLSTTGGLSFTQPPTIDSTGSLRFVAVANSNGTATVRAVANDGQLASAPITFTITVVPVNDPPTATIPTTFDAIEDGVIGNLPFVTGISAGPADEANEPITFTVTVADRTGSLAFTEGPSISPDGKLSYRLAPNTFGTATLNVVVSDGVTGVPSSFKLAVAAVNDPPEFTFTPLPAVAEDAGLVTVDNFVRNLTGGPADEAGETATAKISFSAVNGLSFATPPTLDANGRLTFRPAPDSNSTVSLDITATDQFGASITKSVMLTVTPVNDPPIARIAQTSGISVGKGPQTIVGLATGEVGPANESNQTVTFRTSIVSTTGRMSFAVAPSISPDGTLTFTLANNSRGTATLAVVANDGDLDSLSPVFVTISGNTDPITTLVGHREYTVGSDIGGDRATLYNPNGTVRFTVVPFPGKLGGVRTAAGDFTGDGIADLAVGTGPGSATQVRIIDGVTQKVVFDIAPFESSFTGGVYLAAGDLNGDGKSELAITPDQGGGPRVRVFNGATFTQLVDFFGIDDPNFRGGARAAIGDLTGDTIGDLVVSAGFGGGPRVAAYDGTSLTTSRVRVFSDFFVFEQSLRNGAYIAVGDIDGDGRAELIAGGGPGGAPRVVAFSGRDLSLSNVANQIVSFFAGDEEDRGGVRLAVKNLNDDTVGDVIVGSGEGSGSRVSGYFGRSLVSAGTPSTAFEFDAIADFTGGVFVG